MIRIIAGSRKGKNLLTLKDQSVRPTLGRVRESLFNILQMRISESDVLDLFSGSGAFGIECLSRGCNSATFCDSSKEAVDITRKNLSECKFSAEVIFSDYAACLKKLASSKQHFELIYLDPPYDSDYIFHALKIIFQSDLLTENGIVIFETRQRNEIEIEDPRFELYDERHYGIAKIGLIRRIYK